MRPVFYHRHAVRYLRRMPEDRKQQVKDSVNEVAALDDVLSHPNVRVMKAEWEGCFRLRVGGYRAIFRLVVEPDGEAIEVLLVGPRGDIY